MSEDLKEQVNNEVAEVSETPTDAPLNAEPTTKKKKEKKPKSKARNIFEWVFTVCDPFFPVALIYQIEEFAGILILFCRAVEIKVHCFQRCQKLSAKHAGKHFDWDKELFPGRYPLTNFV